MPSITAATGMDALTHCIEAYLARDYHPICDGVALEGLRLTAQEVSPAQERELKAVRRALQTVVASPRGQARTRR